MTVTAGSSTSWRAMEANTSPDATFVILEPYWKSVEGKNEAQKMKEKRSLVGKCSRGIAGFPSEPSDQVSP
jgi:hypothetical protein